MGFRAKLSTVTYASRTEKKRVALVKDLFNLNFALEKEADAIRQRQIRVDNLKILVLEKEAEIERFDKSNLMELSL